METFLSTITRLVPCLNGLLALSVVWFLQYYFRLQYFSDYFLGIAIVLSHMISSLDYLIQRKSDQKVLIKVILVLFVMFLTPFLIF